MKVATERRDSRGIVLREGETVEIDTGRLSGGDALLRLVVAFAASGEVSTWDRAAAVVDEADAEVVRRAMMRLFALHMFGTEDTEARIAMRNVRVGDYVRLHGGVSCVREALDNADQRTSTRGITLKVNIGGPGGHALTYCYPADVTIPLVARERRLA